MKFQIDTEKNKITIRGNKLVYAVPEALKSYLNDLEMTVEKDATFLNKNVTHYLDDGHFIKFGVNQKTDKEVIDEDGNAKTETEYTFIEYFRFDLTDYTLKDKANAPLNPDLITSSRDGIQPASGYSAWASNFYSYWSYSVYGNRNTRTSLSYLFRKGEYSELKLRAAEKFYRSGFPKVQPNLMVDLLNGLRAEDLKECVNGAPHILLGIPKKVYKAIIESPEYIALFAQYRALRRVRTFPYWDQIASHVDSDPELFGFALKIIVSDSVDRLIELLGDRNYNHARLLEYLSKDLPQKQGLKAQSRYGNDGIGILLDYSRMASALYDSDYEKYPKHLRTEHDVMAMKCEDLKEVLENKRVYDIYRENNIDFYKYRANDPVEREIDGRQELFYYRMDPLNSAADIVNEGKQLRHCVAIYVSKISPRCAILSCNLAERGHYMSTDNKCLTIELNPQEKIILQAKGMLNRKPTREEFLFLQEFCIEKGVDFSDELKSQFYDEFKQKFSNKEMVKIGEKEERELVTA